MDPSRPLPALALRSFDKVVLAACAGWLATHAVALAATERPDAAALAETRAAVEAYMQTGHVAAPEGPTWSRDLRQRLAAPANPNQGPAWVFHRRPAYLYQTEGGPEPVSPVHGELLAPTVESPARGVVRLRWERPELDVVLLEGYELERALGAGAWETLARPAASATDYTDETLPLLGGLARYRLRSRARLDAADPQLAGREVAPFPAERVSPVVEAVVARRLRVRIHGVEPGDELAARPGVAQGELLRWRAAQADWERQWFSATAGSVAGRGAFAGLGVRVLRVWTQEEPAGGLTRTVEWAEVEYPDGARETLRAGASDGEDR